MSDPMDCSLPGSSVHGILQVRILEWVITPFSRGSSWPRDQTRVSYIAGRFFTVRATGEAPEWMDTLSANGPRDTPRKPWNSNDFRHLNNSDSDPTGKSSAIHKEYVSRSGGPSQ